MGNFSKYIKPENPKKQEIGKGKNPNPSAQLKDNRSENALQLKLSEIANSHMGMKPVQRAAIQDEKLQLKGLDEEELQMKRVEDEEELQMKGNEEEELQLKGIEEEEELQMKSTASSFDTTPDHEVNGSSIQRAENNTGLPNQLKSGIENLSGYSLDEVKVHYNSDKPAQLNAHAYAQGNDIHVAPGQEKHLPHEAWHVVQQKQGRVKATRQLKGKVNINDDAGLEAEADRMGAKALQLKETETKTRKSKSTSQVVQRSEDTAMTDSRMDALVNRVLAILGVLTAQGEDWEKTYGDKGRKLGQRGVEKAKGALLGSGEKEGPSLKEKVVKEGLKRWWASLEPEEKADMFKESVGLFSGIFGSSSGGKEKEKEKVGKEEPEKPKGKEKNFESDITSQDLKTLYDAYKGYGKIKSKIEEFESGLKDLAEELGTDVGVKVGEFRNEREFLSKFEEQRVPYKVAKLEFAFLKETIEKNNDTSRYHAELEALSDALDARLQGPSAMINNPSRFTGDKEQMAAAVNTCTIAYQNLKTANLVRNGTTSLLANLGIGVDRLIQEGKKFIGGLLGISPEDQPVDPKIGQKQGELVTAIQTVSNKSWYWHTSGIFASKPNGVAEVGEKLVGNKSAAKKLAEIKEHLIKPEIDLVDTADKLSSTDDEIGKLSGSLGKDLTVDKGLSETRTQKSTEKFVGKQVDNTSRLAELGTQKIELELKKRGLEKKIKGQNRKPLTQVFYNAIKDLQPDNLISLGKTIAIMEQIGAELDNQKHTKD